MGAATDWDLFQSLHAVLEAGSLSAAARARGLTQPTLGRHIEALEQRLGAPLFLRSPRGLQPTDLALELRPRLEIMASAAAAALRDASGVSDQTAGSVRVTASEIMGCEVLPQVLADFHVQHPAIEIELTVTNRNEDLLRREADIAVRMSRPTQSALLARKCGVTSLGFHAAPAYVDRRGAPADLDELETHTVIGFDSPRDVDDLVDIGKPITRDLFAFRCDSDIAVINALKAGLGVGVCQHALARRAGLVQVMPNLRFELEIWVCMHESLKQTRRMRLMFDHLVEAMTAFSREA